jgi:hypothetical protein
MTNLDPLERVNTAKRDSVQTAEQATCGATVWDGWHRRHCSKRVTHDGYCATHHPDAVKARHARSRDRFEAGRAKSSAERASLKEQARRAECYDDLLAALLDLVERCDGEEGVRADGSNIQTMLARAVIAKATGGRDES